MRHWSLLLSFIGVLGWGSSCLACAQSICPNDPNGIVLQTPISASSVYHINQGEDFYQTLTMSVWLQPNTTSVQPVFSAFGIDQNNGIPAPLSLEMDVGNGNVFLSYIGLWYCMDDNGNKDYGYAVITLYAPVSGFNDGHWHNVVVGVTEAIGMDNNYNVTASAIFYIDGVATPATVESAGSFDQSASPPTFLGIFTGAPNDTTWTLGKSNSGLGFAVTNSNTQLAEFYLNFSTGEVDIDSFYSGGKAPGLGINCTGPTGSAPNMCNRGDPCDFPAGRNDMGAVAYRLKLPASSTQPILNGADTDPCLFSDGHGMGCPVQ